MKKKSNVVEFNNQLHNRTISSELVQTIKAKIDNALSLLYDASKKHTASHGDNYYFKDEYNEKKSCEALGKYEHGVYRRPNPYEKKALARDAEHDIDRSKSELHSVLESLRQEGFDE